MNTKLYILLIMCICFIHCADNKKDEFVTEDQIIYDGSREILVNMLQESVSLNFIANGNWSLQIDYEQDYDWIEVSQSSGGAGKITIELTVKDNDTMRDRTGYLYIKTNSQSVRISINQKGFDEGISPKLQLRDSYYILSYTDTTIHVMITYSHDFDVIPDVFTTSWVSYLETKTEQDSILKFRVDANSQNSSRSGFIVFKSRFDANVRDTLFLDQKAIPEITLNQDRFVSSYNEMFIDIPILSNCEVSVEIPNQYMHWIEYVDTLRQDYLVVRLKIAGNDGFDNREAYVDIVAKDNREIRKSVQIIQYAEKKLLLEKSLYYVPYKLGVVYVPYRTNALFTVNYNVGSGLEVIVEEQYIKITYPQNNNPADLEHVIYLNVYENDPSVILRVETVTLIQDKYPFSEGTIPDYKPENWD